MGQQDRFVDHEHGQRDWSLTSSSRAGARTAFARGSRRLDDLGRLRLCDLQFFNRRRGSFFRRSARRHVRVFQVSWSGVAKRRSLDAVRLARSSSPNHGWLSNNSIRLLFDEPPETILARDPCDDFRLFFSSIADNAGNWPAGSPLGRQPRRDNRSTGHAGVMPRRPVLLQRERQRSERPATRTRAVTARNRGVLERIPRSQASDRRPEG